MKNHVFLLFLGLAGPVAHAQQPVAKPAKLIPTAQAPAGYQELLLATINELQAARTLPATRAAVGKLDRAAAAAPTDWLPLYYQGLGYVQLSFLSNDEATRDKCLDQAQVLLDKSRKLSQSPGELLVLQGYLYQARLAVSPMLRAMEYGPKASAILQEAHRIDPQNPRASYLMGSNLFHKPALFGGGGEAARPWLEQAVALYAASHPATPTAPRWGQTEAKLLLAQVTRTQ
ncbi:MAG: hypothetical protein ACRYG7_39300 [Janthinobacterium lividum]